MMSHTGTLRMWHARVAVLLFALISAVLLVLLASDGRSASAQTPPQMDPWAWGRNDQGQLGNGTTNVTANPNPTQVSKLTDVLVVAGGGSHSLAIKSDGTGDSNPNDGTAWAWGINGFGQLGYDPNPATPTTFENSNTPSQVSSLTDVVAVAGGNNHSLAVKSDGTDDGPTNDGTVYAWGFNNQGQLGNGTSGTGTNSNTPVQVIDTKGTTDTSDDGPLEDVVAVAGGTFHSLALKSNGTVWAWGINDVGQLGNGTTNSTPNPNPVQVIDTKGTTDTSDDGPLEDVVAIAAGSNHNLAVKSDGTVWAWGFNSQGMLGNGTSAAYRCRRATLRTRRTCREETSTA
jgi:alpha-tubulin suppressor-like RCC1 family protein